MGNIQTNRALEAYIKGYATGIPGPVPGGDSFSNTYSLEFDGVDDYISIYDGASGNGPIQFTASDSFTFSAWIKTSSTAATNQIISFRGTALLWFSTFSTSGNIRLKTYLRDDSSNVVSIDSYNSAAGWIAADTWTNVIFTRNGTTNELNLYLNGNAAQVTVTDTTSDDFTAYDKLSIANDNYSGGRYWYDGMIDEVSIWSSALSGADVATLYNSGLPSNLKTALASTPVAWWRNGDSGTFFAGEWDIPDQMKIDNFSSYSMAFDGVDDTVNLNCAPSDLGITNNWTMSLWIKTSDITQNNMHYFSGASAATSQGMGIFQETNNRIYAWVGQVAHSQYSDKIVANTWYHVAYTDNGTTQTLYLNGVSQSTQTRTVNLQTDDEGFYVGSAAGSAYYIDGNVDDVAIFDAALSGSDITAIYNSGVPKDESSTANLVGYWRMGEGATFSTNWTIPDDSSNSNDGTSANMTEDDKVNTAPGNTAQGRSVNMDEVDRVTDVPT